MTEVVMYTTTYCGFCAQAKYLMDEKGIPYKEINLDEHPNQREEMLRRAEGRSTVPQIFIDGMAVGGCDELYDLERRGKLDELLRRTG